MTGYFDFGIDTDHQPELRLVFDGPTGTDYTVTWHASEPGSSVASQGCMWEARVYLLVESAGDSATVRTRAVMEYEDGSGIFSATYGPGYGYRCTGSAANTLDTTEANELKLEYRGMDSSVVDFRVSALLVWIF